MKSLIFPRNPGIAGTRLPSQDFNPTILDAEVMDFEGKLDGNTINERMRWVADPAGSGQVCVEYTINTGDIADQWGGDRSETWPNAHDVTEGDKGWRAWAVWFPTDFSNPGGWGCAVGQVHDGGGGSPITTLGVNVGGQVVFSVRSVVEFPLGLVQRNKWYYCVQYTEHTAAYAGVVKFWLGIGSMPNINNAPTYETNNCRTLIGGNSWDKWGLYQGSGANRVIFKGYGRAATASEAIANARLSGVAPTPTPAAIKGSIVDNSEIKGQVSWTANNGPCEFYIDDVLKWTENYAPYVYNGDGKTLDTTALADGRHKFEVRMKDKSASNVVYATVKNTVPTTALDQVKLGLDEFRMTTGGYATIKATSSNYPLTHTGKAEAAFLKAIQLLGG